MFLLLEPFTLAISTSDDGWAIENEVRIVRLWSVLLLFKLRFWSYYFCRWALKIPLFYSQQQVFRRGEKEEREREREQRGERGERSKRSEERGPRGQREQFTKGTVCVRVCVCVWVLTCIKAFGQLFSGGLASYPQSVKIFWCSNFEFRHFVGLCAFVNRDFLTAFAFCQRKELADIAHLFGLSTVRECVMRVSVSKERKCVMWVSEWVSEWGVTQNTQKKRESRWERAERGAGQRQKRREWVRAKCWYHFWVLLFLFLSLWLQWKVGQRTKVGLTVKQIQSFCLLFFGFLCLWDWFFLSNPVRPDLSSHLFDTRKSFSWLEK